MAKKRRKKKPKPTPQELEKRIHVNEVRKLMENIGFSRVPRIDGKEFIFESRTAELDDIFIYENVVILAEYTTGSDTGTHLLKKKVIFDKISANSHGFLKFLLTNENFKGFQEAYGRLIAPSYTTNQLQIRIIYASKFLVSTEHKAQLEYVKFFDYSVLKYFESIAKVIKRTAIYEFVSFLEIPYAKLAANVKGSSTASTHEFSGHLLPEEHSSFKEGYKLVSFYIDANSLLRRAFVLRRDGWRNRESIGLYQRMFVAKKIKSMRKYLHQEKRVFINNIIVTLSTDSVRLFDKDGNELRLDSAGRFKGLIETKVQPTTIRIDDKSNIVGIIDGQHRLYCYHEGDDAYEQSISSLRNIQNLLITGILFPKDEHEEKRIKFQANLFLEINSNQSGATSQLKQEIEFMMNPFSTTSISKYVINKLNESGPLAGLFEEFWFQKSRLKTASIISFGLRQIVKFEGTDSLFSLWTNKDKHKLKSTDEDYDLLYKYRDFCATEVRRIFIGLKSNVGKAFWAVDRKDPKAILSVTTINGVINCLRLLVENGKTGDEAYYKSRFARIRTFNFKAYKSSQYRKMGEDLFAQYFTP